MHARNPLVVTLVVLVHFAILKGDEEETEGILARKGHDDDVN